MLMERARQLLNAGQPRDAIHLFNASEMAGESADECSAGRWHCYMLLGRFDCAWAESDAICARNNPDPHRLWDGQPFTGRRVMIRCLHGLGDALQFLRYAPLVGQTAEWVGVQTPPELLRLAAQIRNINHAMTWTSADNPEPAWDQQIEVMELPRAHRTTKETIPLNLPYFDLDDQSVQRAERVLAGTRKRDESRPAVEFEQLEPSSLHSLLLFGAALPDTRCAVLQFPNGSGRSRPKIRARNVGRNHSRGYCS